MSGAKLLALGLAVGLAVPGCGRDADDGAESKRAPVATADARLASAATELETYLVDHTRNLKDLGSEAGQVIDLVEPVDGRLKVMIFLSAEIAANRKPAQRICNLIKRSGVPEAEGALLVDSGNAPFQPC